MFHQNTVNSLVRTTTISDQILDITVLNLLLSLILFHKCYRELPLFKYLTEATVTIFKAGKLTIYFIQPTGLLRNRCVTHILHTVL